MTIFHVVPILLLNTLPIALVYVITFIENVVKITKSQRGFRR